MPTAPPPSRPRAPPAGTTLLFRFGADGTVRFHPFNAKLDLRKRKRQGAAAGGEEEEDDGFEPPEKVGGRGAACLGGRWRLDWREGDGGFEPPEEVGGWRAPGRAGAAGCLRARPRVHALPADWGPA